MIGPFEVLDLSDFIPLIICQYAYYFACDSASVVNPRLFVDSLFYLFVTY